MKKNKKMAVVLSLALTGVLTVGVMSSFANSPLIRQAQTIQTKIEANNKVEKNVLLQVGATEITNIELENYKTYKSIETNPILGDAELLKEMATEKLYLQLSEDKNVAATLVDGNNEAKKYREILKEQPQEVQDTQQRLIEAMGLSEEEYWNEYAPAEYQKILSVQNLTQNLIENKELKRQESTDISKELKEFKEQLFQSAVASDKVKVIDSSVSFK